MVNQIDLKVSRLLLIPRDTLGRDVARQGVALLGACATRQTPAL